MSGYKCLRGILFVVAMVFLLVAPNLSAQTASTGAISGSVTDSSGAVIANVTVTAVSIDTGRTRSATTGGDGIYVMTLLPLGSYRLKFEAAGFNTSEVASIAVNVTETTVLNRQLQV